MNSKRYEMFRDAILEVVPASGKGLPESELAVLVREKLPAGKLDNLGSITWHVNSVLGDLSQKGLIARRNHGNSHRLVKKAVQTAQSDPSGSGSFASRGSEK
jgi:hypothetical protein